ncbi:MAG: hypothetical protein JSS27_07245 [Planctomycetes bacterium]|nr:hypothetical protein [Planctomycetota bacterium]
MANRSGQYGRSKGSSFLKGCLATVGCLGVVVAALVALVVWMALDHQKQASELETANALYANNKRDEAVAKYKSAYTAAPDQALILKRIIEHELSNGRTQEAERWMNTAFERGARLSLDGADANARYKKIVADGENRRAEAARQQAAAKSQQSVGQLKSKAIVTSQDYVKKFLRYPLDAQFPWGGESANGYAVEKGENQGMIVYNVSGNVKAKNALGASLTVPWKTTLNYRNERWELVLCMIEDQCAYMDPDLFAALTKVAESLEGNEPATPQANEPDAAAQKREGEAAKRKEAEAKKAAMQAEVERRKASAEKNRPVIAANYLKIAKSFQEKGDNESYKSWLRKIVKQYPETDAASEARSLLGE